MYNFAFSLLFVHLQLVLVATEWITAPRRLKENHDYTGYESIARVCICALIDFCETTNYSRSLRFCECSFFYASMAAFHSYNDTAVKLTDYVCF